MSLRLGSPRHMLGTARPWRYRLGLAGAVVPIVYGTLLAACNSGAPGRQSVTYPIGNLTPAKAAKGQPVASGGLTITLLDAQCSDIAVTKPGHFLVGFKVAMENPGTENVPILRSLQLSGNADGTVEADDSWALPEWTLSDQSIPVAFQPLMSQSDFAPGTTTTGWLLFALPRPRAFARLYFKPDAAAEGGGVMWDVPCSS